MIGRITMANQVIDRKLDLVRESFRAIGYHDRAIIEDYDFAVQGSQSALGRVDLAAFADPYRHDLQTSCIAVQRVGRDADERGILRNFSYLAPPVGLILTTDYVQIWPVTTSPDPEPLDHVPYDRLSQYFSERARDFHPEFLIAAKSKGLQPSFFDLDRNLFEFAYDATQKILVERFETAVAAARDSISAVGKANVDDLPKAALQILAAAILEDKRLLGDERSTTVVDLVGRSADRYGQYFDQDSATLVGHGVAQIIFDSLRNNVTFRSFTNEMLGYFYENAFVSQDLRKQLGVYYTPRSIAKRILSRLPVEDLAPPDRIIFDGSCGSGNLLLAGYERLRELLPKYWDQEKKHNYLVEKLYGFDLDQFAAQVAGLSLFLIDLPAGDAWNVRTANFLTSGASGLPRPPTILVGNPPFEEPRSSEGRRVQRASLFLEKYLDVLAPECLLGVVLPETFMENPSCQETRRRLLRECEILELWHLPEAVFPLSGAATVIIIAKKLGPVRSMRRGPIRVERVASLSAERKKFLDGGNPRFSYVMPSSKIVSDDSDYRFSPSYLDSSVWDVIHSSKKLGDVVTIRNGIITGKDSRQTDIASGELGTEWKPWLHGSGDLDTYAVIPRRNDFIRYPGKLHRPRRDLEPVFASPNSKVLVNSRRAPGNPWRLYAAIDDVGYFPSQGIHCVTPRDGNVSLEEIAAVLNSPIANAWIDSRNRKNWIVEGNLNDMPFPVFPDAARELVITNVSEIMQLKREYLAGSPRQQSLLASIRKKTEAIDFVIYETMSISDLGLTNLERLFAGYRRPGIEWQNHVKPVEPAERNPGARGWSITGQVLQAHTDDGSVTVWVRGYNDDEPFRIPIPEAMPGWALRSETAFEAEIPWRTRHSLNLDSKDIADFRPIDFAYSTTEELVGLLGAPAKLDEVYGR